MKKLLTVLVATLCLSLSTIAYAQEKTHANLPSTTVIATVDGSNILYSDIMISDENVKKMPVFGQIHAEKGKIWSASELEKARHNREIESLYPLIYKIAFPSLVKELGISVDDQELQSEVKFLLNGGNLDAMATQTRGFYSLVLQALESVYDGKETEQTAYSKFLKGKVIFETWQSYLVTYKSVESRQELKNMTAVTADLLRQSYEVTARQRIEEKKLRKKVDEIISTTDPKFKSALANIDVKDEAKAKDATDYVRKQRTEWWKGAYKKHVTMVDDNFSDIYDYMAPRQ